MGIVYSDFKIKTLLIIITLAHLILLPAFAYGEEGNGVLVFVLDIDFDDDFIKRGVLPVRGRVGHGSIVSRIIYEEAPNLEVINYRVGRDGEGIDEGIYFMALREVLDYRRSHPNKRILVNISLGFPSEDEKHQYLITKLYEEGVLVITSAGNDNSSEPRYPAAFKDEVISVANAKRSGKDPTSNYGDFVDISARGDVSYISRIYLPSKRTVKSYQSLGTSFSAPRITGLLSRILEEDSTLSPKEGLDIILKTAHPIRDIKYEQGGLGAGVMNKRGALNEVGINYLLHDLGILWILIVLFILLTLHWVKDDLVVGLFLSTLSLLVIFPFLLALESYLLWILNSIIYLVGLLNLGVFDYLTLSLGLIVIVALTGWSKRVLWKSTIVLLALLKLVNYLFQLPIFIIPLFYSLLFILVERGIYNRLNSLKQIQRVIRYLGSSSDKVDSLARKKVFAHPDSMKVVDLLLIELEGATRRRRKLSIIILLGRLGHSRAKDSLVRELSSSSELKLDVLRALALLDKPALDILLEHKEERELIRDSLLSKERGADFLEELLIYLNYRDKRELAIEILVAMGSKDLVRSLALERSEDIFFREGILMVLEGYGKEAECRISDIVRIIVEEEDLSLRYQALYTLVAVLANREEIFLWLDDFKDDREEIIRLEVDWLMTNLYLQ